MNAKQRKAAEAAAKKTTDTTAKGKGPKGNVKTNGLSKINEIVTPAPAVDENAAGETLTSEQPQGNAGETSASEQPQENATETLVLEKGQENADETPKPDPVKEALELISKQGDRSVKVFHHKRCTDEKATTKTTLKATETLKLTDGTTSRPNPLYKDAETTPNETPTITMPVYSLKRNKRIYYVIDVTPTDILKAQMAKEALDLQKANEEKANEASAK